MIFFSIFFSPDQDQTSCRGCEKFKVKFPPKYGFTFGRHIRDLCIYFPATTVHDKFWYLKRKTRKLVNWPYNKQTRGDGLAMCQSAWCTHVSKTDRGNPWRVRMVFKYIRVISHPRHITVRPTVDHVSLQKRNGSGTIQTTVDLSRDGLRLRDLFFCSSRIGCFVYDARDAQIMI